jgi:hypothetical protein
MNKINQNISKGLHLHVKWVRVMFIVSAIAILGVLFYPTTVREKFVPKKLLSAPAKVSADSISSVEYAKGIEDDSTMVKSSRTIASEPIQIQIVREKEPFDWKGTITWAIGAMNGFVLIFLNIKNLIKKKP